MAYDLHLADRVRSILKSTTEFSEKAMFGGLSFMVNGKMCCGVLKAELVLRLIPEQVAALLNQPNIRPMDFTGKPIKSMVYVSAAGTDSDDALKTLVEAAVAIARTSRKGDERRPLRRARSETKSAPVRRRRN